MGEHTAQLVDQEVKRTLDEAYERARSVLEKERELLEAIATAVLERETLDRDQVELLAQGKTLPPLKEAPKPDSRGADGPRGGPRRDGGDAGGGGPGGGGPTPDDSPGAGADKEEVGSGASSAGEAVVVRHRPAIGGAGGRVIPLDCPDRASRTTRGANV